jgi:hypothetical protein
MSMQIARVVQLALGVVNAVPPERRAAIAEERLIFLATSHGFAPAPATRRDEMWEAAAVILASVEKLYHEGRLDEVLCGLPPNSPAVDPLNLIDRLTSRVKVGIGRENYQALGRACLEALVHWAQANPDVDIDQQPSTKLRWELGLNRALLNDFDTTIEPRSMHAVSSSDKQADLALTESGGGRSFDVRSGWSTRD